jgi:ankyrin repeat protein
MMDDCKEIYQALETVVVVSPRLLFLAKDDEISLLRQAVLFGRVEFTTFVLSKLDDLSILDSSDLLCIALSQRDDAMVHFLVSGSIGLSYKSLTGETCLHVAARSGRADYVDLLMPASASTMIEAAETVRMWTALSVACIEGHEAVARHLLRAGADPTLIDNAGWTAREHAAYRGHSPIAQMLPPRLSGSPRAGLIHTAKDTHWTNFSIKPQQSQIVIHLGGLQEGKATEFIDLMPWLCGSGRLGYDLILEVSTTTESSENYSRPLVRNSRVQIVIMDVRHHKQPYEEGLIYRTHPVSTNYD